MRSTKALVFSVALVSFSSLVQAEDQRTQSVDPTYEVFKSAGSVLEMSAHEVHRAVNVIEQFVSGKLPIEQLETMSEAEILDGIDFTAEPYSKLDDLDLAITWRKFLLEAQFLAEKANVPKAKFTPFYRNYFLLKNTGQRLEKSLRNSANENAN